MFPYRDDNPTLATPVVTILLIALNAAVWILVQGMGSEPGLSRSVCELGLIPGEFLGRVAEGTSLRLEPQLRLRARRRSGSGTPRSPRCSCTAGGCICSATCGFSGSSETTSKTAWAAAGISSSTFCPGSPRPRPRPCSSPRASSRWSGRRARSAASWARTWSCIPGSGSTCWSCWSSSSPGSWCRPT